MIWSLIASGIVGSFITTAYSTITDRDGNLNKTGAVIATGTTVTTTIANSPDAFSEEIKMVNDSQAYVQGLPTKDLYRMNAELEKILENPDNQFSSEKPKQKIR